MQREIERQAHVAHTDINGAELPEYVRPSVRVMSETELLSAMQINAGVTSWWGM